MTEEELRQLIENTKALATLDVDIKIEKQQMGDKFRPMLLRIVKALEWSHKEIFKH